MTTGITSSAKPEKTASSILNLQSSSESVLSKDESVVQIAVKRNFDESLGQKTASDSQLETKRTKFEIPTPSELSSNHAQSLTQTVGHRSLGKLESEHTQPTAGSSAAEVMYKKWASPKTNYLMNLPGLKDLHNPFTCIKIIVSTGENQSISFEIPGIALNNLSPYFKKMLMQSMEESRTETIEWKGAFSSSYIHPQALIS